MNRRLILSSAVLVLSAACQQRPAETAPVPLRVAFPEVGREIVSGAPVFRAAAQGFVSLAAKGPSAASPLPMPLRSGLELQLPARGEEGLRFSFPDGFAFTVRSKGMTGQPRADGAAVLYDRPGGSSFWTGSDEGFEEWLLVAAPAAGVPVAEWELGGASARVEGEAVLVLDPSGAVRLRVAAPKAFLSDQQPLATRLTVADGRIRLAVNAPAGARVLVDPSWTPAGSSTPGRFGHTSTALLGGRVLVTGGDPTNSWSTVTATTLLYTPSTNAWTAGPPMSSPRLYQGAVRLPDGRVMVFGGANAGGAAISTAEVFDPLTNLWSPGPAMPGARYLFPITVLSDGRVLVTGGFSGSSFSTPTNSAFLFDPVTSTWSTRAPMGTARAAHAAVLLGDGRVLAAGGYTTLSSAELYDPVANTWSSTGSMNVARYWAGFTALPNGKALVVGGESVATAQVFAADSGWSPAMSLTTTRGSTTATLMQDGTVLVAGGRSSSSASATCEIYNPQTNTFTPALPMVTGRANFAATAVASGVLVSFGIQGSSAIGSAELYLNGDAGLQCTSGAQCPTGFCADGFCCDTACNAGACDACSIVLGAPLNGVCTALSNTPCTDGDGCTAGDSCQSGVCIPGAAVTCSAGQCTDVGTCDTATGLCSQPPKADGLACVDGNACTQTDTCQSGVCVGGSTTACLPLDQCHDVGVCNTSTGMCSQPVKSNGSICDDTSACTINDRCVSGTCTGTPVACPASDFCHLAGTCDPATGACSNPTKPEGTSCNDGNLCSSADACIAGVCTGTATVCAPASQCHVAGTCNASTGLCSSPLKTDGSSCDDGNACTRTDTCQVGVCQGGNTVACTPMDSCHDVGVCDVATGSCSTPAKANGSGCDDQNACTTTDRCTSGVCQGTPVVCFVGGECYEPGSCTASSGACSFPMKADGTACSIGVCKTGLCVSAPVAPKKAGCGCNSGDAAGLGLLRSRRRVRSSECR
ncbi:MAG: Kelch repeat-containing protein [Myxococcaceae bacterium]